MSRSSLCISLVFDQDLGLPNGTFASVPPSSRMACWRWSWALSKHLAMSGVAKSWPWIGCLESRTISWLSDSTMVWIDYWELLLMIWFSVWKNDSCWLRETRFLYLQELVPLTYFSFCHHLSADLFLVIGAHLFFSAYVFWAAFGVSRYGWSVGSVDVIGAVESSRAGQVAHPAALPMHPGSWPRRPGSGLLSRLQVGTQTSCYQMYIISQFSLLVTIEIVPEWRNPQ